jgi:Zn-finger nucleic acid-binding protein
MMQCPRDKVDSAVIRAEVRVCPKCKRILDADELLRLLKQLGISDELVQRVENEITINGFVEIL